jgi:hypothetical protein
MDTVWAIAATPESFCRWRQPSALDARARRRRALRVGNAILGRAGPIIVASSVEVAQIATYIEGLMTCVSRASGAMSLRYC